jgi:hypothetical protein
VAKLSYISILVFAFMACTRTTLALKFTLPFTDTIAYIIIRLVCNENTRCFHVMNVS